MSTTLIGIELPESSYRSPTERQLMWFQMGVCKVKYRAVPAQFKSRFLQTASVLWFGLATVACLHPVAHLFGGRAKFGQALGFTIVFYSYGLLFFGLLMALTVLIFRHALRFQMGPFRAVWSALWFTVFTVEVVVFFSAYTGLYELPTTKFILVVLVGIVGGSVASLLTTPLVFAPLIYILLRFQKLWDTLF